MCFLGGKTLASVLLCESYFGEKFFVEIILLRGVGNWALIHTPLHTFYWPWTISDIINQASPSEGALTKDRP